MSTLAEFIRRLLDSLSVNEAAIKTGIDPSVMSRLLRGRTVPSVENMLRIAFATSTHPARLFELAGQTQLAFLCRGIDWDEEKRTLRETDLYPVQQAKLHSRLQRLLELGFTPQIEAALKQLETAWEMLRPAFEAFAQEAGAKAAVLIADTPDRPAEVLFALNCSQPLAQQLAEKGEMVGWQSCSHRSGRLTLTLLLKASRLSRKQAQTALSLWAAQLRNLYQKKESGIRKRGIGNEESEQG